ncbi:threonylcarbamoyl-AMP synthase [bacterium]|nr:threonylcarbamoyl-AMP synthase [bacterium]
MKTKLLKADQINQAVNLLKDGEIVAVPTETVYGLAADALNDHAIAKIFQAKNRPANHPLILHTESYDQINDWAINISEDAKKLAKHFWPGPLTMILQKNNRVSSLITGGLDTVGLRVPDHPVALALIKKLGNGIVAPSANAHKKTSPTKPEHVLKTLDGKIAGIIDGGPCSVGIESTIIDMTKSTPVIVRPGAITAQMIEAVINKKVESPLQHNQKVSGNMEIHYQPDKPLFLLSLDTIEKKLPTERSVAVMHYSEIAHHKHATYYKMPNNKNDYAKGLYQTLYVIDTTDVDTIFVEIPPTSAEWSDVNDRLRKASWK